MVLWNHSKVFHLVTKPFEIIFWQKVLSWGINRRWNLFALAIHPLLKIMSQEKSSKGIMQYLKVSKCTGVASCKLQRCCIPPISLIAVHNQDFSIRYWQYRLQGSSQSLMRVLLLAILTVQSEFTVQGVTCKII